MLGTDRSAPWAHPNEGGTQAASKPRALTETEAEDGSSNGVFSAFDAALDRLPGWIVHALGTVTALIALWFALALLGGLPRGIVEWIAVAMFGAFAYAVGFMIPVLVAFLLETRARLSMVLALVGGAAIYGVLVLQWSA